jgi:hypothetical protein
MLSYNAEFIEEVTILIIYVILIKISTYKK